MLKNDYFCETAGLGIRRNNIGAAGGNQQDTTVTLTAAPDEGYQLASPVTVKATFAPIGSAALPRPYTTDCSANLTEKKKFLFSCVYHCRRSRVPFRRSCSSRVMSGWRQLGSTRTECGTQKKRSPVL